MNLLWLDIETTGTDPKREFILEVGAFATDENLYIFGPAYHGIPYLPLGYVPATMDNFVHDMHTKNGLLDEVSMSVKPVAQVEEELIKFLWDRDVVENKPYLAGFSPQFDRRFLEAHMPRFHAMLHYRNFDISTIREAAKVWCPGLKDLPKNTNHRALQDCMEALKSARYYKTNIFEEAQRSGSM